MIKLAVPCHSVILWKPGGDQFCDYVRVNRARCYQVLATPTQPADVTSRVIGQIAAAKAANRHRWMSRHRATVRFGSVP